MVSWRKSSRSGSQGTDSCVEVANTLARVRDSKNTAAPSLAADVAALVAAVKTGRFDL